MGNKLYTKSYVKNIADAIRAKNGSSTQYRTSEMAAAIEALQTGGFIVTPEMRLTGSSFTEIPENVTIMPRIGYSCELMFYGCWLLESVPLFDTSEALTGDDMFQQCVSLTSVPQFDTGSMETTYGMFWECVSLADVPIFNLESDTDAYGMFYDCNSLTPLSLQNILKSLITATNYSGTKTLLSLGLGATQIVTCTGFPEWTTLTNMGWSTGQNGGTPE